MFTVVSCSTIAREMIDLACVDHPEARTFLERRNSAFSGIVGPDGRVVGSPLVDAEGFVYAEIDLSRCIEPKQMHDITGHYNRFDVFDLRVNRRPLSRVSWCGEAGDDWRSKARNRDLKAFAPCIFGQTHNGLGRGNCEAVPQIEEVEC